ncbi:MAG: hypothetical protein NT080_00545 [Spirochaetes bacterium]|nr:hypothetical protein [Spirochaetota bacterium]
MTRAALVIAILSLMVSGGRADDAIGEWFATDPALQYAGVRAAVAEAAAPAVAAGVPSVLFVERLREAAAKRIKPDLLPAAIAAEAARLLSVNAAARESGFILDGPVRLAALRRASLLLRAGTGIASIKGAYRAAQLANRGAEAALEAVAVAADIRARTGIGVEGADLLASSLIRSSIDWPKYRSLEAIFVKGRASGLSGSTLVEIACGALDSGGTFVRIEQEIERRTGK